MGEIERIYEQKGLDALWEWARGKPERWRKLKEWAGQKSRELDRELGRERDRIEQARADLHELHDAIAETRKLRREIAAKLETAKTSDRIAELKLKERRASADLDALLRKRVKSETRLKKAEVEAHDAKQGKKVWIERKIIYREQWEKAKKKSKGGFKNAKWEDWMAHGLDSNVTPLVKQVMAWGVLDYDLYVTSLKRNYVPPGGSTTSYHLSGKAGDIAGARMTEFQKAVFNEFKGKSACLELFGPDNGLCLKYGGVIYLGEGTPLENLHDTHVHFAG